MAETIMDRFQKSWNIKSETGEMQEFTMPVRIVVGKIPFDLSDLRDVMSVADSPFNAEKNQSVIVEARQLLESIRNDQQAVDEVDASTHAGELPTELSMMLESFTDNVSSLTPAERRIVLYYLNGYEISDIPDLDGITINTVRKHNKNIYRKLQISSREELMMYLDVLERCGLLEPVETMLRDGVENVSAFDTSEAAGEKNHA